MAPFLSPHDRPLRFAPFSRADGSSAALLLAQRGTVGTEVLRLADITTTPRLLSREELDLRGGHEAFERLRLSMLCDGWHFDNDSRPAWRTALHDGLGGDADDLRIDLALHATPIGAHEREVGRDEFAAALSRPDTIAQLRYRGAWGLLTSTDYNLYQAILPKPTPSGVRWQECLGDIGGVTHPVAFTALFRIAEDGACALIDLLGYDGFDLRKSDPAARQALLRQLVAELAGAGARWGSWQMPVIESRIQHLDSPAEAWHLLALTYPGSSERMVLRDPR